MTKQQDAKARGMLWVECPECHGEGSVPSPDHCGQAWCMTCEHGEGGWAVWPDHRTAGSAA